jgi:hypothetical protein
MRKLISTVLTLLMLTASWRIGADAFWRELLRRGLFDADLAMKVAAAEEGLFCWPEAESDERSKTASR